MNKPDSYDYYSKKRNNIPFRDWPEECKAYKNYLRIIRIHPEWKDLSDEEIKATQKENQRQNAANARMLNAEKWKNMSQEEKEKINKKKGNGYNQLSDAEKLARNEELKQRSLNFWNGMSEEERKKFSEYRESRWSEESKQKRI